MQVDPTGYQNNRNWALSNKSKDDKEVNGLIKENKIFKDSLQYVCSSANRVIGREES